MGARQMNTKVRSIRIVATLVFSLTAGGAPFADPGAHSVSMWQVEGERNRVYLMGSIHLLREQDYPLSPAIYAAYEDAEVLYMELDMDDADPIADQMLANELGLIQDGRTLGDLLGPADYAKAEALAADAQIPLQLLQKTEPWYAAIQVELIMLLRIGFNPELGVESHLLEMAQADSKEIYGLETVRQQLGFLDGLSAEAQRDMFMQTLSETQDLVALMDSLIDAWHRGDNEFLEDTLLDDIDEYPELNRIIVTDRNEAWTDKIEELLTADQDYLVVVGALHLIGPSGVPELLRRRDYDVRQVRQSANQ